MWQNFRNVGSAMQALGNVVAPPMEDDDEDDYDEGSDYEDEDGEELEEADDINSQEHEDDVLHSHSHETPMVMAGERISPLKTGLGFVGMIARALDRNEEEEEEEDGSYEEYEDYEGEEVVELYSEELPDTTQQITTLLPAESTESEIPLPTEPPLRTLTPPRQPQDDGWGDIHTTWEVNNETFQVPKDDSISEMNDGKTGQRRSIQRETGSVSPITSSKKSLLSSSSPMGTSPTPAESSTAGITENLKAQFPELPIEPESSAVEPSKQILVNPSPDSENDVVSRVVDKQLEYATKSSWDLPETEAPPKETSPTPRQASWPGSNNSSKKDGASPRERRGSYKLDSESKGQQRRSSKVSLSDARFLAELPRAEDLETADRWGAPKSTSMRNKPRSSSTKDNQASRHSLDSYFDDSSLSSVSTRGRKDRRKSAGSPSKADLNMHLSASSPTLDDTQNLMQEDKSKKSTQQAEARFRTEPARTHPTELPARDMRFASTKSHVAPPPEPQRQASRRQWSDGSARNKAEIIKTNIIETGRNSAEFESLVTEAASSVDPPRNPIRKGSGDQTPMIPEAEPRMGRRPPLVTGNSKDGDIVPRRPVQRMPSHNEERANTEEKSKPMYPVGTTATMNGIHSSSPDENKRLAEFQQRCLDLEAKLKEALDTKEMVEQKLEQEEAAREEQLNAFREKEARFFDASAEAQEQMMRELNTEMERRVAEVSSLLEDQQRQHEVERAEWQATLKDAEDQLQSASSGGGITDELSNMMEDQQRQHESERAEWQKLLREAEDQIKTLKTALVNGSMDTSESVSSMMEDKQRQHEQDRAEWQESLSQAKAEIDSLKKSQGDGKADTPEQAATMMKDQQRRHEEDRAEWQELLGDAEEQLEKAQKEKREILARLENASKQNQQRQDRAVRIAEDKLAQTLAILDEREEQIAQLKNMVKSMSDEVHEHREGVQEVEDEADELRRQNEVLQHRLETVETQRSELHEELQRVQGEIDKMANLKMELRLLKEDRQRERAKSQSVAESASSNSAKLATERDAALAEVSSLRQQLAAVQADVEISQQDAARALKASENLQMALESIQGEREAELSLLEEQRRSIEESTAAAHAAALEATHEANEARIREVRNEAQTEVLEAQAEIRKLEEKVETFRTENVQMRRSLDEAISRLQHNQEDVIDRTLMKNILLDWLTKTGNKEKRHILELMASVLHFTDEEKGRVHIGGDDFSIGKVVATVAPTPPPPKADIEHLQGSNVREKWVNFLLAETDD